MGLFRDEVVQARRGQWLGAINLATPISYRWWAMLALALAAAAVAFLIFGQYTRRETVSGQLLPTTGVSTLASQTTGTVSRTLVHEGQQVSAGQPLVEISANLVSADMGDIHAVVGAQLRAQETQVRDSLANLQPQAAAQAKDLQTRIGMLGTQVRQIDGQLTLARKQAAASAAFVQKIQPVVKRGIISVARFNAYQSAALNDRAQVKALERQRLDAEQQRSSLQAQLTQLPLDSTAKANQLRGQLAQLDAQLAQNAAEGGTLLRAPRAGVVSTLLVKPGQAVQAGQSLLSILPRGAKLEAQLLVPSSAIGFVSPGNQVVLRYQAYPYQKFGQQYGKVVQVSRSALSPAETMSLLGRNVATPLYRVLVKLDHQTINAYGKLEALKPGMALNADIMLDRRNLWQWVFEPLYGLRQQLAANDKGSHQG
ncbi:MAG TPA: HlyD family efflux transporter periplasmic adaptor subunit [Rhodanobacteraceae bacterium]|nr:HlyD family efflux transporter periplasmic adaptor subunit [Rhodanobacteraceae bacterium]